MPFQVAPILFVVATEAFFFVCSAIVGSVPYLWILPACFVIFWFAKYGYAVLGRALDGDTEAPVASLENFGPFDGPGPLVQLLLGYLGYRAALVGGFPGLILCGVLIAVMPASIAVLATAHHVLDALNPLAIARVIRGLGRFYALLLVAIAAYVGLAFGIARLEPPAILRDTVWGMLFLSSFGLIGGVLYERRLELGIEPRISPERHAAKLHAFRAGERQRVLDEVYGPLRARDYALAVAPLATFLGASDTTQLAVDVPAIMSQVTQWNDQRGLATVTRCVISSLLRAGELPLALGVADDTSARLSRFALDSEPETLALARYAQSVGRARLGFLILERFAATRPDQALGVEAAALRQELQP
jgi:hypothetical protein